jgi:hypothetical protein
MLLELDILNTRTVSFDLGRFQIQRADVSLSACGKPRIAHGDQPCAVQQVVAAGRSPRSLCSLGCSPLNDRALGSFVGLPQEILERENRSLGSHGEATLGRALELSVSEWRRGNLDRELRLHLLFLAWYCNVEPPPLTGFIGDAVNSSELPQIFGEVYETFADQILENPECLYVVGLMALSPWPLGDDVAIWEARSEEFRKIYRELVPDGLPSSQFTGRGAFGEYFAEHGALQRIWSSLALGTNR